VAKGVMIASDAQLNPERVTTKTLSQQREQHQRQTLAPIMIIPNTPTPTIALVAPLALPPERERESQSAHRAHMTRTDELTDGRMRKDGCTDASCPYPRGKVVLFWRPGTVWGPRALFSPPTPFYAPNPLFRIAYIPETVMISQ
jgi:hypothetical protein